ncbi:MAG: molybdate ABC transporter substrate-binding protein [Chloroflexota bacterium]
MKRFWITLSTAALLLSSCASAAPTTASATDVPAPAPTVIPSEVPTIAPSPIAEPVKLTVFAAASLTNAFGEIGKAFEAANPGVTVKFNFGGSQTLRTQVEQGAPGDIFVSANAKEMDALVKSGFVATNSAKIFLTNQLVVIMPKNNPARLVELKDLEKPGLKLVLAAKEVPVGNYALQVLDKLDTALGLGFKTKVLANVVSYENDVKQVVSKIQLGEADAGIVYLSDTVAAPDLKKIEIPTVNNVVVKYPLAALTQTKSPDVAQAFIDYVLSPEGLTILQKWGFLPVK